MTNTNVERTQQYQSHKWAWYDFKLEPAPFMVICSECKHHSVKGEMVYTSRSKKGNVMKRVCSEECGRNFDYREMAQMARNRASGNRRFS